MTSIEAINKINQACAKSLDSLIKTKKAERDEIKAKLDKVQAEIDDLSYSYTELTSTK